MRRETAQKVLDMVFSGPSPCIKIEFQGGEPTLNWPVLQYIVRDAQRRNKAAHKQLDFVVCTNLIRLQPPMVEFFKDNQVGISTSLDGPAEIHDRHRLLRTTGSSYRAFRTNLDYVRGQMGNDSCSALLTITKDHLGNLNRVIDEYVHLGFPGIFLRSLNPYGMAAAHWDQIGYPIEAFVEAYKDALRYIIDLNLSGHRFEEYYAVLILTRILTPFSSGFVDLQSPAGGGISGAIYDFNGEVYPCDEGRMLAKTGDKFFCLGNVYTDSYESIFSGEKLRRLVRTSCVETLPGCATCAYQMFCGADPTRNYVESHDIVGHRPTSNFCRKHYLLIDHFLDLVHENRPEIMRVFWSWMTGRSSNEVRL